MKRRVQIFLSLSISAGLLIGASAVAKNVWYYNGAGDKYTPQWVTYVVAAMVVLAVLSPILTWPRPWRLRKQRQ